MEGSKVPDGVGELEEEIAYLRARLRSARTLIDQVAHVVDGASKKGRPSPRQKTLDVIRALISDWENGGS